MLEGGFRVMVFNVTFKNISVKLWRSVLLVEETEVPEENHWPAASHWQTLNIFVDKFIKGISIAGMILVWKSNIRPEIKKISWNHILVHIYNAFQIVNCWPVLTVFNTFDNFTFGK